MIYCSRRFIASLESVLTHELLAKVVFLMDRLCRNCVFFFSSLVIVPDKVGTARAVVGVNADANHGV